MAFVVVDLDGCLIDDVHERFGRFLRREDSVPEHALKELVFNVLDRIPSVVDSVAKSIDMEKWLNLEVVRALKQVSDRGIEIVVRTANNKLGENGIEKLKKVLGEHGVKVSVEVTTDKRKFADRDGEKPLLVLDDKPNVVMGAARKGIRSVLIKSDYNRAAGMFAKRVNKLITVADPKDMEKACLNALGYKSVSIL
ncbi:MAG: hypothetical protein M1544_00985 [Candidatus Marsarchaeota archaeon]|nr:hypothetical protein [Candidatus Marsarchaeota archaeon]MCL5101920.1 hypothetical protein [Candidatus Marsarchaeota archaeon]